MRPRFGGPVSGCPCNNKMSIRASVFWKLPFIPDFMSTLHSPLNNSLARWTVNVRLVSMKPAHLMRCVASSTSGLAWNFRAGPSSSLLEITCPSVVAACAKVLATSTPHEAVLGLSFLFALVGIWIETRPRLSPTDPTTSAQTRCLASVLRLFRFQARASASIPPTRGTRPLRFKPRQNERRSQQIRAHGTLLPHLRVLQCANPSGCRVGVYAWVPETLSIEICL